jgi:hypothetical protein
MDMMQVGQILYSLAFFATLCAQGDALAVELGLSLISN